MRFSIVMSCYRRTKRLDDRIIPITQPLTYVLFPLPIVLGRKSTSVFGILVKFPFAQDSSLRLFTVSACVCVIG